MLTQFALSWESYKNNVCGGFTALQQNEELVDMTLAADGHLVKVHKLLLALASPYIKQLIDTAPCPHPVIFLNNVSYPILSLVLEYIYSGEVMIPSHNLPEFMKTAKALHIKGLEDLVAEGDIPTEFGVQKLVSFPNDNNSSTQVILPPSAKKIKHTSGHSIDSYDTLKPETHEEIHQDMEEDYTDQDDFDRDNSTRSQASLATEQILTTKASTLQYTVSIRGSLQVILNRYIYNLSSVRRKTGIRKWKCVDYRGSKCPAIVATKDNIVISRLCPHNHPFHDKKILAKVEKNGVYSAIEEIKGYNKDIEEKTSDNEEQ